MRNLSRRAPFQTVPLSDQKRRSTTILIALGIALIAAVFISPMLGRYPIPPIEALKMLASSISIMAFCFSLLAIALVLLLSSRAKGNHPLIVVLTGVMVSSLFSAGVS